MQKFKIKNTELILLPEKSIYLPDLKTLLISDLHIGKSMHFRNEGIAVPEKLSGEELNTISFLLGKLIAERIIVLGDLFHNTYNPDWDKFCDWRFRFKNIKIELVAGNHDILPEDLYRDADINIVRKELELGELRLTHKVSDKLNNKDERYVLAGHVHPAVKLTGPGRQKMKLPCFYFGERYGLLPAFGRFTGNFVIQPESKDRVFVIVGNNVVKVN